MKYQGIYIKKKIIIYRGYHKDKKILYKQWQLWRHAQQMYSKLKGKPYQTTLF